MEYIQLSSLKLAYERRGGGAPILLIHGFPLDHESWDNFSELLLDSFDMIMPDLPGFGASELPLTGFSIAEMASALAELLDVLNIHKAYITGHSMGGYVALAFAHAFPDRVLGLALIGSQAIPDTPERKSGRYITAAQVESDGVKIVSGMAETLSNNPELVKFFLKIIMRQRPQGISDALRANAGRADSVPFLSSFNFPIVLVHGNADVLVPVERARDIKTQAPHAVLVELNGVGHSPMLEAPEVTAASLRGFLHQ